jgi:ribosomal protein S27AE
VKAGELLVQVRCLQCGHKSLLSNQALADFGIKPEAPIVSFVKRLRCGDCGSGSVIANRIAHKERAARRLRA